MQARSPEQPPSDAFVRPTLAERILAIMRREPSRRPFPCWELCKRLWINWRTEGDRVPGDANAIVMRVLKRLERDGVLQRDQRGWGLAAFTEEPTMWDLRANLEQMKFSDVRYPASAGQRNFCHVGVFTASNRRPLVVISEHPDSRGVSVTNASESIAKEVCLRFAMNPGLAIWIEHYPPRPDRLPIRTRKTGFSRDVFDSATWDIVEYDCSELAQICNPKWRRIGPETWAALAISPEMIEEAMDLPRCPTK